ncbi:MAG: T9SS type A sorting domain-containing protein [Bacteroidota bacterium]
MRIALFACVLLLAAYCAEGQPLNVVIDSTRGSNSPSEPCIAIDPKNPNNLIAGANTRNVYRSVDGGYTWTRALLSSTYGVFGDPVIFADTTGSFYYFHLSNNSAIFTWPDWCDRIVCQRLDDVAAGSWSNGSYAGLAPTPSMQDKPWVAVNRQTNELYVTWTRFDEYGTTDPTDSSNIFFSKSADKGETWSPAVRLNKVAGDCVDDDFTVEGAVPAVGKNGELFVAWDAKNEILFDRSYDNGATWQHEDIKAADMPSGWAYDIPGINRCNGLSFIACDLSNSAYAGTLYINWSDQRNGPDNTDVWLCRSTDSGSTWSAPVKVNDDGGSRHQFMSSMTVDPSNGFIYVLFYDRRNYTDSLATDVYLALSKDGGVTFENHKISQAPFYPRANEFFGDYTYISAFNSVVRPVWGTTQAIGAGPANQKIMTAIIGEDIIHTSVDPLANYVMDLKAYPNPLSTVTNFSYVLAKAAEVTLAVTDVAGRTIAIVQNEAATPGRHTLAFDAGSYNMAPGLYFATLKTMEYSQTIKLQVNN